MNNVCEMPKDGQLYTRSQIAQAHGGSSTAFLPTVGGHVVCACLRTEPPYNPEAPFVILPGKGLIRERSAEVLSKQTGPIPIYIKIAPNAWKWVGYYEVASYSTSPKDIDRYSAETGRPVTSVIRMRVSQP
jgi:hypothetical protein